MSRLHTSFMIKPWSLVICTLEWSNKASYWQSCLLTFDNLTMGVSVASFIPFNDWFGSFAHLCKSKWLTAALFILVIHKGIDPGIGYTKAPSVRTCVQRMMQHFSSIHASRDTIGRAKSDGWCKWRTWIIVLLMTVDVKLVDRQDVLLKETQSLLLEEKDKR